MICHSKPSVSLGDIYSRVTDEDLLSYYFNIRHIPCILNSPLREDHNPSFVIYYNKSGKLVFFDFGTKEYGGMIDLISKYFHLSFKDTICKIYLELNHIVLPTTNKKTFHVKKLFLQHSTMKIEVKARELQQYDLDYWNQYGINKEWLNFGNIYPISDIFIEKENETFTIPAEKYAYAYVEFKDGKQTIKVYQPFSKNFKWMSNHDASVWDLWQQLPQTGDKLIITSSRKDALCLWANLNIPACCLQGESHIPKDHVIQQLIDRFKQVYIFYDNDKDKNQNVGQLNAQKLIEKYNLINIKIEDEYNCKDPSDLYKKYGKEKFLQILKPKLCI